MSKRVCRVFIPVLIIFLCVFQSGELIGQWWGRPCTLDWCDSHASHECELMCQDLGGCGGYAKWFCECLIPGFSWICHCEYVIACWDTFDFHVHCIGEHTYCGLPLMQ